MTPEPRRARTRAWLPPTRGQALLGFALAVALPFVAAGVGVNVPGTRRLPASLFILAIVFATIVGRLAAGLVSVVVSAVLLDYYFVPPRHDLSGITASDAIALTIFAAVALVLSELVSREAAARDESRAAAERARFLARTAGLLGGSLDWEETLRELGRVVVPDLADWYSVEILDEKGYRNVAVAHVDPRKVELARELRERYPPDLDAPTGAPNVIRTGRSEHYEELPDELLERLGADEEQIRLVRDLGLRSIVIAPLTARGRTLGAMTLVTAESGRIYRRDDVRLIEELAERAALAIDNARLYRVEQESRRQLEALNRRAALLSTVSELLARTFEYPGTYVRFAEIVAQHLADLCLIDVLADDGQIVRVAAAHRDPERQPLADRLRSEFAPSATGRHPVARVIRTGAPEFLAEMTEEFLRETTRDEEHFRLTMELGFTSFLCVPLAARGAILGTMTLVSCDPARRFGPADVEVALEVASRAGLHIDNARLYVAEREAREAAEGAESRLAALSEASRTLASSLDYEETVQRAAEIAAREFGDHALLFLKDASGQVAPVSAAPPEPDRAELSERLLRAFSGGVTDPQALVTRAVATGQTQRLDEVTEEAIDRFARTPEQREIISELGPRSLLALPLRLRDEVFGALAIVSSSRPARFGPEDVLFAEELTRRMARAIENSRLYHERDHIAQVLQRGLLPGSLPAVTGLDLQGRYRAAGAGYEVGGDFYDVVSLAPDRALVVVGDVCGKGPEAAAVMGTAKAALRALVLHDDRPRSLLTRLNEALLAVDLQGRFLTACCALVETNGDPVRVTLSLAGHPRPAIRRGDGEVEIVGEHGPALGLWRDFEVVETTAELRRGDAMVVYTDGLEARDAVAEDRVRQLLTRLDDGASAIADGLLHPDDPAAVGGSEAEPLEDDIALVVLKVAP